MLSEKSDFNAAEKYPSRCREGLKIPNNFAKLALKIVSYDVRSITIKKQFVVRTSVRNPAADLSPHVRSLPKHFAAFSSAGTKLPHDRVYVHPRLKNTSSVESIPNLKSKILSSPEFIRGVASKI
ncbi:MAG: hypothetical protein EAZ45_13585 [Oscillatoriales cyanobacterium]|nr:MAG: hypothetical protein EAZ45_13585 [Oscillatoriales cyanobacterium]